MSDPNVADSNSEVSKISDQPAPVVAARPTQSFFSYTRRSIGELRNVKFALTSFVINNLRRRYRRSILGFAWSLLNPLFTMAVMTCVFSVLWRSNPRVFALYIFVGLLPWSFVTDSLITGAQSLIQAEHYLKKVYVPKMFFPLVVVLTELVNFVLSLCSLALIAYPLGLQPHVSMLLVPFAIVLLFGYVFSLVLFLSIATVYFRDLTHIIKVVLNGLFYLLPIIYTLDMVPEQYRVVLLWNPFFYFIELFHKLIYAGVYPTVYDWLVPSVLTISAGLISLFVLMKTERDLIYRL